MRFESVQDVCDASEDLARSGKLSEALQTIADVVREVSYEPSTFGRIFSSRALDEATLRLGRVEDAARQGDEEQVVFIVTALFDTGGHSRLLVDLRRADPATKATILVSNMDHDYPRSRYEHALREAGGGEILALEVSPDVTPSERLAWMQDALRRLRPTRTYLLQHHYDTISIAAAQPELSGTIAYVHHCDHSLALGVHLPNAMHVDVSPNTYFRCKDHEGVEVPQYWPTTVDDPIDNVDVSSSFTQITTCSCGSLSKFQNEIINYRYDYFSVIPDILAATRGSHLHIGPLPDEKVSGVRAVMLQRGIEAKRFIHLQHTENLSKELIDRKVSLYLVSFPIGGGRASIEAMAAGIPIVAHVNYRSQYLSSESIVYPEAFIWEKIEDLIDIASRFDPFLAAEHSRKSRSYYLSKYSSRELSRAMSLSLSGKISEEPRKIDRRSDDLQVHFDDWWRKQRELEPFRAEIVRLKGDLSVLKTDLAAAGTEIQSILSSRSWRYSAPLRKFSVLIEAMRGRRVGK